MRYTNMSLLLGTTPPDAAARAVRFIMARPHGEYTEVDIAGTIVPSYVAVCAGVGLNGRWAWPGLFYAQKLARIAERIAR